MGFRLLRNINSKMYTYMDPTKKRLSIAGPYYVRYHERVYSSGRPFAKMRNRV